MTNEQKRTRNWQKARLIGFGMNDIVMTPDEQDLFQELMRIKFRLLDNWDSQTEILIGHPLPPYKCYWCGKRGTVPHMYCGNNYCSKHYKEFIT